MFTNTGTVVVTVFDCIRGILSLKVLVFQVQLSVGMFIFCIQMIFIFIQSRFAKF